MKRLRTLIPALLLALAATASADPPAVVVHDSGKSSESTINLQNSQGASCAAPAVGNCGACSVSCTTGKAASCKPGLAVNAKAGASCVTAPECKCQ
ncbi:MAG: hypothetical protein M0P19_06465 [Nevskia sp.]|nr:hypothetical protein [Nevskia sp.]MCK9385180.1 hypothetical protein [Nevskia sp.]